MNSGSVSPSGSRLRSSSPLLHVGSIDLSGLPPIHVIPAHLTDEELHAYEDDLIRCHAPLTYDTNEAKIFIGNVHTKKRAQFELRKFGICTTETTSWKDKQEQHDEPRGKKRKLNEATASLSISQAETEDEDATDTSQTAPAKPDLERFFSQATAGQFIVIKTQWLKDSTAQGHLRPLLEYIVYEFKRTERPHDTPLSPTPATPDPPPSHTPAEPNTILARARADTPPRRTGGTVTHFASAPYGARRFRDQEHGTHSRGEHERPKLLALDTNDDDSPTSSADASVVPPAPDWVKQGLKYSCQRVTLSPCANEEFVELLKQIRLARLLTSDEIGVRAYSTSIASICSVPTRIVRPEEILRLPGCDVKIANLWIEFRNTGSVEAAREIEEDQDEMLKILKLFYDIWGVGDKTAREFFDRGWRDLDDVVEYGWSSLSRVQQIGLKYYEELKVGIPKTEVEFILGKVKDHAIKVRDGGIEALVVGGYRRGKEESGDVDIIISHRDLAKTENLVVDVIASLEEEGWITHTLRVDHRNSERGQTPVAMKTQQVVIGSGFDTLDKGMVVWQDTNWATKEADLQRDPKAKNPNIHRRVDIIISPWRTVGCAVLGWSGGTTFQRDVRRYAKYHKEWKFDSSGIRSRRTGEIIRLEGLEGISGSMVDAEKKVFEGLGLVYREPWERCTG